MEGLDIKAPQWCLVDGGKAIVHVMTDQARETWEVENVAMGMPAGAI
jgi:ribosomal silencing factor RsfS